MTGTAVATAIDHPVAREIRLATAKFAPFLPAGSDVEHIVAQVFIEAQRVPKLLDCTPASIVSAATRLVSWGFDIGRTGYLVPFGKEATPVPSFKGLIELVLATGAARDCDAREVREGDLFEYEFVSDGKLRHVPGRLNAKRGRITHFYVCWHIRFGHTKFDVMTLDEVEDLRLKYSKQWGGDKWARGECEAWYGIKSVIRRSAKQLPQNPKLSKFFAALEADQTEELGEQVRTASTRAGEPSDRPGTPAEPIAASFEVVEETRGRAVVTLPNWRGHQLANKTLDQVDLLPLNQLYKDLTAAADKGDHRYDDLIGHIEAELEARRVGVAA